MENIFVQIATFFKDWLLSMQASSVVNSLVMGIVYFLGAIIFVLINALALVYLERKMAAYFQERRGPNRAGPY